MKLVVKQLSAS